VGIHRISTKEKKISPINPTHAENT
jgi:hypothetical protein